MNKDKNSVLQKVYKVLEESSDTNTVILLAVEFNAEGVPISRLNKIEGNGSHVMAGLQMIQRKLEEEIENWHEKLDLVTEMSQKMDELFSKMGIDGMDDPRLEQLLNSAEDEDIKKSLKKAIKRLKDQFGK